MGGPTKNLDGKRWLNASGALFQKPDVLFLGLANTAKRGAKTDADAVLGFFARILEARMIEREFRGSDRELRIAVEPFQAVRRKELLGLPVSDFTGAVRVKDAGIKSRNATDATFLRQNTVPK